MEPFSPVNMRRPDRASSASAPGSASASAAAVAAASRQKSCNACVRGKRRCDKTMPRCNRCALKGLDCVYQKNPATARAAAAQSAAASARVPASSVSRSHITNPSTSTSAAANAPAAVQDMHHHDFDMSGCGFDMPDLSGASVSSTTTTSPESLQLDPNLGFTIEDMLAASSTSAGGQHNSASTWDLTGFGPGGKADFPPPVTTIPPHFQNHLHQQQQYHGQRHLQHQEHINQEDDMLLEHVRASAEIELQHQPPQQYHHHQEQHQQHRSPMRDVTVLNSKIDPRMCLIADPLQVHDPRSQIGYVVQYFTNMHAVFAQTRKVPFIHSRLYHADLPRTMMAAFCAATTYANQVPATKPWAMKVVADAANDIKEQGATATTLHERLARVHALLLVDTIRVFDGDIALRHAAGKERGILVQWIKDLAETLEEHDLPPEKRCSRDYPPDSWDEWILFESTRRTVILAYAFLCVICILQSELPDQAFWSETKWFTSSSHIWNATTSVDFYRAWREMPRWVIVNCQFKDIWMQGRPEDLDDFSKFMLTTQTGTDVMDHFMQGDIAIHV